MKKKEYSIDFIYEGDNGILFAEMHNPIMITAESDAQAIEIGHRKRSEYRRVCTYSGHRALWLRNETDDKYVLMEKAP